MTKDTEQKPLTDLPIDKKSAERIAYQKLRSEIGNIPSPGVPKKEGEVWKVPVLIRYPKVIFDEITGKPKKTRFIDVGKVGDIEIKVDTGDVISRPRYHDISSAIQTKINSIRECVEKALAKVGSKSFAQLPFPEHMHTPFHDILSWILIEDKIDLSDIYLSESDREKYLEDIKILANIGLVRLSDNKNTIIAGNNLIEIEDRGKTNATYEIMQNALAFFFEKGYNEIESIRRVIGPYLALAGFAYEESYEYEKIIGFNINQFKRFINYSYRDKNKLVKIPRYLVQLSQVNIFDETTKGGIKIWKPNEDIYHKIEKDSIFQDIINTIGAPQNRY